MKNLLILISLLISVSVNATVLEPFGFTMGMGLAEVTIEKDFGNNIYQLTPTNPSTEFSKYEGIISPTEGLCKITAVTNYIITAENGAELRSQYSDLKKMITAKHGKPSNHYDFLNSKKRKDKATTWMVGLEKKERRLQTFWNIGSAIISLKAEGISKDNGRILIIYEFENFEDCKQITVQKNLTVL